MSLGRPKKPNVNFLFNSVQSQQSSQTKMANNTIDFYCHHLSQRTIKENEEVREKIRSLSQANRNNRTKKKHIHNLDKYNTRQMLHRTKNNLIKSKFILQNILDDGKTTTLMKAFKEYEIYLIPNSGVYYHLDRNHFKDKAFLLVNYESHANVKVFIDKNSPRPSNNRCDLALKNPKIIQINNLLFEFSYVFICFKSDESCHISVTPYPNKESLPVSNKGKEKAKKLLTLRERQALLLKNGPKIADISKTRKQIKLRMDHLVDYPTQMDKFQQQLAMIKSSKAKNHSSINTNIQIAQHWGSFRKMKLERLSSATRVNKSLVIKKRKQIEKIKRSRETSISYWERKRKEEQEKQKRIRIEIIKQQCIIVWNSQILTRKYFADIARKYEYRRREILHKRSLTLAVIKIAGKLRYKLKKQGQNYEERTIGLIRSGLNYTAQNMRELCEDRSRLVLKKFLENNCKRLELHSHFYEFHSRMCLTKDRLMAKMVIKKTRIKMISQYWNNKLFEMMDKYKDSSKKTDKARIKLNKLKGISTLVKEIMIQRYYDQCKLEYCVKFFKWRKKYKEFILKIADGEDLYQSLSIAKRKKQIRAAMKLTDDIYLSDEDDNSPSRSPGGSRSSPKSGSKKRRSSIKKYKRQKETKRVPILADSFKMHLWNASMLENVKNIDANLSQSEMEKTISKAKVAIAHAYLSHPPQMNFVPDEEILEKLIWAATKYRYAKDIPRVL
ncbi:unnamed protein product [Moneuplotes crassus]|uniref:Uncharacterized protein n=1 Tax=Euplotes crassus TaxID=5936 RepID=A0AAD1Y5M6_EUPCR|nr:unnamed protein product [Moneuplotes crassus]